MMRKFAGMANAGNTKNPYNIKENPYNRKENNKLAIICIAPCVVRIGKGKDMCP